GYAGLLRRTPMPPPRPDRPRPLVGVAASVRYRRVLLVSLAGGLFSLLDAPFLAFVVADMRARGSSTASAELTAMVLPAGGIAGSAVAGRVGRGRTPAHVLLAADAALVVLVPAFALVPITMMRAAAGFGFGVAGLVFWVHLDTLLLGLRPGQAGTVRAVSAV